MTINYNFNYPNSAKHKCMPRCTYSLAVVEISLYYFIDALLCIKIYYTYIFRYILAYNSLAIVEIYLYYFIDAL